MIVAKRTASCSEPGNGLIETSGTDSEEPLVSQPSKQNKSPDLAVKAAEEPKKEKGLLAAVVRAVQRWSSE